MGTYRKSEYYDIAFEKDKYNCHFSETVYYEMWKNAITWIDLTDIILEIGCGTGQFAWMLEDHYFTNYTGIDFSKKGIEVAESMSNMEFKLHDARVKLDVDYDTVICFETLEHIDNDILVLENLKKGAKFIGSVPIGNDPAHVRVFKTPDVIRKRYRNHIDITKILQFGTKYLFRGVIK